MLVHTVFKGHDLRVFVLGSLTCQLLEVIFQAVNTANISAYKLSTHIHFVNL